MKASQAIEELNYQKKMSCFGVNYQATTEAVDMAISALEKQEGKKPIDRRCPNCESDNVEVWQDGGYRTTKFSFCPDCGQRIDWSNEG